MLPDLPDLPLWACGALGWFSATATTSRPKHITQAASMAIGASVSAELLAPIAAGIVIVQYGGDQQQFERAAALLIGMGGVPAIQAYINRKGGK